MKINLLKSVRNILLIGVFLLLFEASGTPLQSVYNSQVSIALLVISVLFWGIFGRKVVKNWVILTIIFFWSLVFTMIVNGDSAISHYIGIITTIVSVEIITSCVEYDEFESIFIKIITVIAVYSVMITIYSNIDKGFPGTLPIFTGSKNGWRHIGPLYYYWGWSSWTRIVRNAACFREPGVWGCYCCLALMLHIAKQGRILGVKTKRKIRKAFIVGVILVIGALTSLSTTAILCLGMCFILYVSFRGRISRKQFLVLIVSFVVGFFFLQSQSDLLFSKFDQASNTYVSLEERTDGIRAGIDSILRNPLLGSGYTYYIEHTVGTSANSFVDIWGKYGILFLSILIYGLVKRVKKYNLNGISEASVFVLLVFILGTQNLLIYPIFMSMCFYGLKKEKTGMRFEDGQSR